MSPTESGGNEHCVIVGASHAGVQCATRLRRLGFAGRVTLVSEERHNPYHRPPLSKDYLTGEKTQDRLSLLPAAGFAKSNIELRCGERAVALDRATRTLQLQDQTSLNYDHLVLALGARARRLDANFPETGVHYLRHIDDVGAIQAHARADGRAVVVGGGYIGLEVAASLRKMGMAVTLVEAMERVLQRVTGETVSDFYRRLHASHGVTIIESDHVVDFDGEKAIRSVRLASGRQFSADLVVVGIGVIPNTDIAQAAGLEVENGICVNEFAQTNDPHVYAIGDCASIAHPLYSERLRIESVHNAGEGALAAARSIVGSPEPYTAVPWFWSDQYDVKLQIAGLPLDADKTLVRGDPNDDAGFAVLHLRGKHLVAIEAINRAKDFVQGRKLITDEVELDPEQLMDPSVPLAP